MSSKSSLSVGVSGELTSAQGEVKKLTKSFMRANNKVAELIEEQQSNEKQLTELNDKKKKLTEKVNEEIKSIKLSQKQVRDKVLFELGERSGFMKLLKELGATVEEKQVKQIPSSIKVEVN